MTRSWRPNRNSRAFLLLEILVYIGLLAILLGVLVGATTMLQRGLRKKVAALQQASAWRPVETRMRNDLRRALSLSYAAPSNRKNTPSYLRLQHPDKETVEYHFLAGTIKRTALREGAVVERQVFPFNVDAWRLQRASADRTRSVWDLEEIEQGVRSDLGGRPVFLQLSLTVKSPELKQERYRIGATTRCE